MDATVAGRFSVEGHVAYITGAATGIGEGIARLLAAAGAPVAVIDIDAPGAARVADDITARGGKATACELDVTDPAAIEAAFAALAAALGPPAILVNNAGSYRLGAAVLDITVETWRAMLAVNLDSVFYCAQAASRLMIHAAVPGSIVNITSVDGVHPYFAANYDTPKAGANFLTQTLALDLSPHGIRVNAIAPGAVAVETLERMRRGEIPPIFAPPTIASGLHGPVGRQRGANIPLGRIGTPEDIANATLFLCSPAASYITGHVLVVDGGWLLT